MAVVVAAPEMAAVVAAPEMAVGVAAPERAVGVVRLDTNYRWDLVQLRLCGY